MFLTKKIQQVNLSDEEKLDNTSVPLFFFCPEETTSVLSSSLPHANAICNNNV
jgi:hypothetical protein